MGNLKTNGFFGCNCIYVLKLRLITAAGPQFWPMSAFTDSSTRAVLLTYFLPLVIIIILFEQWLIDFLMLLGFNPALASSLTVLYFVIIFSVIVTHVSQSIGSSIDLANVEKEHAIRTLHVTQRDIKLRNQIARIFLTISDEEMYKEVLKVILEYFESKDGIFGYIDEHGNLICPSRKKDIMELGQDAEKTIAYPLDTWNGVRSRALKEKICLYSNDGLNVPEGHVPGINTLAVQLWYMGS